MRSHNSEVSTRREQVALLHARSFTEEEIACELGCDQSTVSRDLKVIKEEVAQQFIFDLARFDLAYYYKGCLDVIDQVKRECWHIYNKTKDDTTPIRDRLAALSLIKECSESQFKLLAEGPSIMAVRALEERLDNVEQNIKESNR